MLYPPRIALAGLTPEHDRLPLIWALLSHLTDNGMSVQAFSSRSDPCRSAGTAVATAREQRHLDSWVMSKSVCQELFCRGSAGADLAVIEGCMSTSEPGGRLATLCDWLDVRPIAVVDARRFGDCRFGAVPAGIAGVLLDNVRDSRHALELGITLRAVWNTPVVGWMTECACVRQALQRLPSGQAPPHELCQAMQRQLSLRRPEFLKRVRPGVKTDGGGEDCLQAALSAAATVSPQRRLQVALAFDEALDCYFPDTLDALEVGGARVRTFSPLRSACLPPDTDLVYLGCGLVEPHLETLASNHCLHQSLREHVQRGGRIYAEGGGTTLLCEQVVTASRQPFAMAGVLPARAVAEEPARGPQPVQLNFRRDCWLGPVGERLRGYRHGGWRLESSGPLENIAGSDLVGREQVVASRVHLHFVAQPALLARFFHPHGTLEPISR